MSLMNEKEAFGKRLTRLLNDAGIGIASPTLVAREFNRRYPGKSVTTQAVRKWLNEEAIPAGDKIRALAKWLKASPHWLHYEENEKSAVTLKVEEERGIYGEDAHNPAGKFPALGAQAQDDGVRDRACLVARGKAVTNSADRLPSSLGAI